MGLSPGERSPADPSTSPPRSFRGLSIASVLWGFCTIVLGAEVTFGGYALACPTWPSCFGSGIGVLVEASHRGAALVLSLLILGLFVSAVLSRRTPTGLRYLSAAAFLLVVTQALVGGALILSQADPDIVILHLSLAVLLFGVLMAIAVLANLPFLPRRWQRSLLGAELAPTDPEPPGGPPGAVARGPSSPEGRAPAGAAAHR